MKQPLTIREVRRGVVIVRPKQPMCDWVNRVAPPVQLDAMQQDCLAILVPDLFSLQDMQDYLEPLKPLLFEMELESWYLDRKAWPAARTAQVFDEWFDLEPHSEVWDAAPRGLTSRRRTR